VTVKRWLIRIAGVALLVLGAALWARADEPPPVGAVAPPPAVLPRASSYRPLYFGPSDRPDPTPIQDPAEVLRATVSAAPAPAVTPTAVLSSTAPAAATAPPAAIVITIPHDDHLHLTHVRHWHFPARPAKTAPAAVPVRALKAPAPPDEPVRALPSPQAPGKFGGFFRR
jgi:hypothetical protein